MKEILQSCKSLPEKVFASGSVLLEEGGTSGLIYIMKSGEVEILKRNDRIAVVNDPGSILGEISALLNLPHMATVRTTTESVFHVVQDPEHFLTERTEICYPLAVLLARRLHSVTNYLADIKEQFKDQRDHFGMVDEILDTLVNQQGEEPERGSDRDPF